MVDRTDFKHIASDLLFKAKNLQTLSNDCRVIPWVDVADQLEMDPANLSKIVTGVTDCRVSTFFAILRCLGCSLEVKK